MHILLKGGKMYTQAQLERYLQHIDYPRHDHPKDPLQRLAALQRHHQARIPFESVSLHYSKHRLVSLDPDDLLEKMVGNSRGGYCMEVNTLFAAVLRTLGFQLISAGARVKGPAGYGGWYVRVSEPRRRFVLTHRSRGHMVNLVSVDGRRYLVDVAYGSRSPTAPVPLYNGTPFANILPREGRLDYRRLEQHSDPGQRMWVYSAREGPEAPWTEQYAFVEMEFFPSDFRVMNLSTMTAPTSFFVQNVVAVRTILEGDETAGVLTLFQTSVKETRRGVHPVIEELLSEEQRVGALEKHFWIRLSPGERAAIRGLTSELQPTRMSP